MKTIYMLFSLSMMTLGFSSCASKNLNASNPQNLDCSNYDTNIVNYAINGDKKGVECALKQGAKIEDISHYGYTALIEASRNGYTDTVKLLFDRDLILKEDE